MTAGGIVLWIATLISRQTTPEQSESLSTGETVAWVAAILGPLSAIIGYVLSSYRSKKDTDVTRAIAAESASTAGRHAASEEFSILTQAYQAEFARLNRRVGLLEDDNCILAEDVNTLIDHLERVEQMVPDPPGAPERPRLRRHISIRKVPGTLPPDVN